MSEKQKKVNAKGKKSGKKANKKMSRKQIILVVIIALILVAALAAAVYFLMFQKKDSESFGDMPMRANSMGRQRTETVTSVTEEGSISVGTVTQSFEMDLSEFTGSQSGSFSWTMGGGSMPQIAMGGMTNMGQTAQGASGSSSSDNRQLLVEEVFVEVGQEVKAGDPILTVTESTLNSIRSSLQSDVTDAKSEYDQLLAQQKKTEKEAATTLKENQLYGQYADTEYSLAVEELQESVDEITASLEEKNEELTELNEELLELQAAVTAQQEVLKNAEYIVEYEDRLTNTYSWLSGVNAKEDAQRIIENLETEIETLEESIASLEEEIVDSNLQLLLAQRALESGMIEAEGTRQIRQINGANAQEIYDVKTALAEFESSNAKEAYEAAVARLEELDSYLANRTILAEKDGVVTDVIVSAGDSLALNSELISLNSYDDITITLTLDESEIHLAAVGASAVVTVPAFPNEVFEAKVTEHGDAQIDSNTNTTTYEVTVTIQENTSRLYEGMSAEVTFGGTADENE